jgi:hypothetical protein
MVGSQVEELLDGFRLDSPYPMDKGLTRGTILEGCDDLVVRRIGELSTVQCGIFRLLYLNTGLSKLIWQLAPDQHNQAHT